MLLNRILSSDDGSSKALIAEDSDAQCDCACISDAHQGIPCPYPVYYYLELTPSCNNLCPGCGNVFFGEGTRQHLPSPLPPAAWQDILLQLQPHARRLRITGGEPTMHPEFENIVLWIGELGIPFVLFTNGRWQDADGLLALLGKAPQFQGFLVSLHGATPKAHETFSGVSGSFQETVSNIQQAVSKEFSVSISTIITHQNYQQIAEIVQLADTLGVSRVVFARYLGKEIPTISPADGELKIAIREIEAWRAKGAKVRFGNCIPQCFHPSSSTGCLAGIAFCTIDPWGRIRPCNHSHLIVGDLLNDSVEECWHSAKMRYWRALVPEQCQSCAEFARCHGGCRAIAQQRGQDRDPLIQYNA